VSVVIEIIGFVGMLTAAHVIIESLRSLTRKKRFAIMWGVTLTLFYGVYVEPRIQLSGGYHQFADQRTLVGFPRTFDVLSNALFMLVGTWGLVFLWRPRIHPSFVKEPERLPYFLFFAGVVLTGIGSAYYHLQPGNSRLSWDLLPMTMSFMSLLAATIMERISLRAGLLFLPALVLCGFASVLYWQFGELRGEGDYRFYLFAQYFPALAIAAIIILFPPRYTRTSDLFVAFLLYALAKIFELCDYQIFSLGGVVSGHSLKHLTAGLACYFILRMLRLRRKTGSPSSLVNAPANEN